MHLVGRGLCRASDALAGERHEVVGADDQLATRLRGIADEVVGEDRTPCGPVLGVQVPAVASFELLDGLECQQRGGRVVSDHIARALCHCGSILVYRSFGKDTPSLTSTRKLDSGGGRAALRAT